MDKKPKRMVPEVRFKGFTDDWEQRKLGEVAKIIGGGTPNTKNPEYWNGKINWYTPAEIGNNIYATSSERKITEEGLKHSSAKVLPIETILFTSRAGIGKTAILTESAATNQGFQSIVPNRQIIDSYFLYSLSNSLRKYGETHGAGSTFVEISGRELAKANIKLPKLWEQKLVSKLVKSIDKLLSLQQRKLKQLKQVRKAMLRQLLGPKKDKSIPNIRFKNFTEAWEQRKLGEVATFINGRAYKQRELLDSGKYKVLRVGNFYTNDSWYYSNLELADKYYIDKGDLVYTWSATFGPHIWNGEKVIYHYHIWKIVLSKFLDRDFTLQILKADKAKLLVNTNGSTMIHVTKKDMESKIISLPNIEEQKRIGSYLIKFDSLIALQQRKTDKLSNLKKFCLQKIFI
ncbi:restriction endonuclease subunit S [Limosilactobacillus caviae]|uniref:Type I restriction enzyme specificity protein n=1 Tax=Limosilactobacillus caviae TaxID=1769424 RepID=A0ABQ2C3Q0_9LACO|nr:restriction endonuclease subunit S [Limosilactobacillus caviae]MCD7124366.1 restriction endonuclease subunit S [Limosilactobacillus caviae]MRH45851.1 restriction endonuclease subunit S [Limosilactobacillus reuteri]GGI62971.1 type I restriction enzyme specificity protein [Limosilactobacillus caviae]